MVMQQQKRAPNVGAFFCTLASDMRGNRQGLPLDSCQQ